MVAKLQMCIAWLTIGALVGFASVEVYDRFIKGPHLSIIGMEWAQKEATPGSAVFVRATYIKHRECVGEWTWRATTFGNRAFTIQRQNFATREWEDAKGRLGTGKSGKQFSYRVLVRIPSDARGYVTLQEIAVCLEDNRLIKSPVATIKIVNG